MEIRIDKEDIFIGHLKYTEKIIRRFKFDSCNAKLTPIEKGVVTGKEDKMNDQSIPPSGH